MVGGGYIGLEVAENLRHLGMEVSLIEAEKRVALAYGPEVAERIEEQLNAASPLRMRIPMLYAEGVRR